jgi:hypothetical protein
VPRAQVQGSRVELILILALRECEDFRAERDVEIFAFPAATDPVGDDIDGCCARAAA